VTALTARGFAAGAVHGDLGQGQRERAMRAFRAGKVDVLVATDVAARGLDVDDVTHVINLECPEDDKAYLHRIGRTGRAGRTGVAVTFVDWRDLQRWKLINDALGLGRPEPAETYSTSEHLYTALGIPRDVKGTLPRAKRGRLGLEAEEIEDIGETGRHRSREEHRGSDGSARTRESRPRKQRVRRRTRAGVVTGDGGGKVQEPTAAASSGADATHGSVLADEAARERSESESRSRRRPRHRGGRGRRAGGTADAAEATGEAVGASSAAAADGAGPAGSAAESA
jgi:superfamily II DNA/RNA helicase